MLANFVFLCYNEKKRTQAKRPSSERLLFMFPLMNFHTHTTYCDGANTPKEMVEEAIARGFKALGFSGHGYTFFDLRYCMTMEATEKYLEDIFRLKQEYKGDIEIYAGVETDLYSDLDTSAFDFVIGSLHYLKKNGEYFSIDGSPELFKELVKAYEGDLYTLAEDYFSLMGEMMDRTRANIIGHFDLITKYNEKGEYFNEENPRYRAAAEGALDRLLQTDCIFEINTGAIARGYRTLPYPSAAQIGKIAAAGNRFVLTSDCHQKEKLDFFFEEATHLPFWKEVERTLITDTSFIKKKT